MSPSVIEIAGSVCFALAILHTFSVHQFQKLAGRYREGSAGENFFHLLGEVEVVFGLWAAILFSVRLWLEGAGPAIGYLEGLNFTEPAFVFVILSLCSTRPILFVAEWMIQALSNIIPLRGALPFYFVALTVGPLLGSFITEPAAMTVIALILVERFYSRGISSGLMYATLGLLFVNVSIGGTLTPYAAPPVLMVAQGWGWDLSFMLSQFGWRGALACVISTSAVAFVFRKEISSLSPGGSKGAQPLPAWVVITHLLFLMAVVATAHHMAVFVGLFLFFMGLVKVTQEYQTDLKLKEGMLVAFFLGGLVVLGPPQRWWLEPILTKLEPTALFWGATALTAITDNAALTYLGAQVPDLSDIAKIALVSGAVVGGGLTVIANAPNPAGYGILNPSFKDGISPLKLFIAALPPTIVAAVCFWLI